MGEKAARGMRGQPDSWPSPAAQRFEALRPKGCRSGRDAGAMQGEGAGSDERLRPFLAVEPPQFLKIDLILRTGSRILIRNQIPE